MYVNAKKCNVFSQCEIEISGYFLATERIRVSGNLTAVEINFFDKPENPLKLGLEKVIQNIENLEWFHEGLRKVIF